MDQEKVLLKKIIEGLQEKKGKNIMTVDMRELPGSICQYFVICEGNTPIQVSALSDSVWDYVYETLHEKPMGADGVRNAQWIAMDYGTIMLHIFLPELRNYYKLENLWADAKLDKIPDIL
ncbi:MAG: ribosome silencing factor [Dysgonamonadaceae bacterium]|jgi:ribosome-associated protein|nr:ribosome silencing factor [Dysgonamonadaceae bacterium]